jgi:hypothetical protein
MEGQWLDDEDGREEEKYEGYNCVSSDHVGTVLIERVLGAPGVRRCIAAESRVPEASILTCDS